MTVGSLEQYGFAWNNFLCGGTTVHSMQSIDGLTGLPSISNQDDDSGYSDGMFTGTDFLRERTITITFITKEGNGNSAQKNADLLKAAFLPQAVGTTPLQFQLVGRALQRVNARVREFRQSINPEFTYGYIVSQVTFFCPDPNIYDDTAKTVSMVVGNPLGRTYPRVYPLLYGGGSSATTSAIVNDGWGTSYPVITLVGPIVNPTLGNVTQGKYITLNYSLLASDTVVIDLSSKLITLNGVSARNLVTGLSDWFTAPAGTSQFYLNGSGSVAGVTTATVVFRSAYI